MSLEDYPMTELLHQAYEASASLAPSDDGSLPDDASYERYDALMTELERRLEEQRREESPSVKAEQARSVAASSGTMAESHSRANTL